MENKLLCSAEEFVLKSNEILKSPFKHGYSSISGLFRNHATIATENQNESLANALELASNICSMMLYPESINEPFRPYVQLEGKRSALPDDFSSDDLAFIHSVFSEIEEPFVQARFADLLWLCVNPKQINHVHVAIEGYLKLPINPETWHVDVGACLKRSIRLALQIKDTKTIDAIESRLLAILSEDFSNSVFMHLWVAEVIVEHKLCKGQAEVIANQLLNTAENLYGSALYREAREYLQLSERMFKIQRNETLWLKCLSLSAESFEYEGDLRVEQSQAVANLFYENALQAYRKIPVRMRDNYGIKEKIDLLKSKIRETGDGLLDEFGVIQGPRIEITEIVTNSQNHVSGKGSLEIALLYFTGFSRLSYKERYENTVKNIHDFPLSNMFAHSQYSSDGRVIDRTPAIGLDAESKNETAIFHKMIQNFHQELQIVVQASISPALDQILSEYRVTRDFLYRICFNSPIVPQGHEVLMANALWHGFEQDFRNSIYLLAPQIEHVVRVLLKEGGVHTSNIDKNGIENENGLSTLLDHEQAKGILGEDLLFEFKAIFTESVGSNLRNEVAHGLLDDESSNSNACVYAWWLTLCLIVRSLYEHEKSKR